MLLTLLHVKTALYLIFVECCLSCLEMNVVVFLMFLSFNFKCSEVLEDMVLCLLVFCIFKFSLVGHRNHSFIGSASFISITLFT